MIEGGFPHSEIRGSKLIRSSPRLIAAYHVLHRLLLPRHPPNALKALDRSHYRYPPRMWCDGGNGQKDQLASIHPAVSRSGEHGPCGSPEGAQAYLPHDDKQHADGHEIHHAKTRNSNEAPLTPTGGARRDRTDDLKLAKLPLSQLSYGPDAADMVGLGGLEPPTSRLSSARSNQLSYKPDQRSAPIARAHPKKKRNEDGAVPPNAILTDRVCSK